MELLLESLVFHYPAVVLGSVWAWLAILLTAVSVWQIRAVRSFTKPDLQPELRPCLDTEDLSKLSAKSELPKGASIFHMDNGYGSLTKGRYTAYFLVDANGDGVNEEIEEEDDDDDDDDVSDVKCEEGVWWKWPVGPMGVRIGDLGWYRFQDLTAIDGNVVKLWEQDSGGFRRRRRGM